MQPNPHKEDQPAENREDVTQRKRRFQIVKLEERIAPRHGKSTYGRCHYTHKVGTC
jgi:hypothetical protein